MKEQRDGVVVRTLRERSELSSIRDTWRAFAFHPWSDFDYYLDHLARQEDFVRPHVLVLERAGRPIAIVVGSLRRDSLPWRVGSLTLAQSRGRVLRVGGGGVLGETSPAIARVVTAELQAALRRGEADAVYLHQVDSASPLLHAVQSVSGWARDRWARPVGGWALELPATYEDYLASRTKSVQRHLKRYARVLEKALGGDLSIACYRQPADLDRLMADSEAVACQTYHRGMGVGFEDTPSARAAFALLLGYGWLRAHVMYAKERPIAFWHGLVYGKTLVTRDTGYAPEFSDLRPGNYLLNHIIEEQCRTHEVERLDYGIMELDYKRHFGTARYERTSIYLFSPRPKGLYLSAMRSTSGVADRAARKLLGPRARTWARKLGSLGRSKAPAAASSTSDGDEK